MAVGNFGDVIKHMILLELIDVLTPHSGTNFKYFETHGSSMSHEVTTNHSEGIIRLNKIYREKSNRGYSVLHNNLPTNKYLNLIQQNFRDQPFKYIEYFSSWYQVHEFLARKGNPSRLDVCEINYLTYAETVKKMGYKYPSIHYSNTDGYSLLRLYLASGIKPHLVLIDPYYSGDPDEVMVAVSDVNQIVELLKIFDVPYLVWYPVYESKSLNLTFKNANNHIEVNNYKSTAGMHMDATGMIFSDSIIQHVSGIRKNILFLNHLGLGWQV